MTALDAGAGTAIGTDTGVSAPVSVSRVTAGLLATLAPRTAPALERRRLWERRYARRVRTTDVAVVVAVVTATAVLDLTTREAGTVGGAAFVASITVAAWLLLLVLSQSRSAAVSGAGATEYKRVAHATGFAFGILAMTFVLFQWDGLRLQLLVALPLGLLGLLVDRWSWRKWLRRQRRYGHYASRAIVTGDRGDIETILRALEQDPTSAFLVLGVAVAGEDVSPFRLGGRIYPVVGPMTAVAANARTLGADTIIVAGRTENDPDFIRRLSWELEGTAAELVISSRLADVAGPRISLRPVDGLPLIHVKIPQYEGGKHSLKRALDVVVAALALLPIALITPLIALAITVDSRGPIFFRQTRVGRDGREFGILKFRTMCADAEARLPELQERTDGNGVLFKMRRDPRITRVGAVLRKFSLDELPQFWNVLRGDMSVVGPRPPLPQEVHAYDGRVFRRLYIKPGITGLWQVSGRSDLSWEESVRLDLRYVENWSITSDLMIMWRTAKVMVAPEGAY